jgi:predicted transcriptional regulator
MKILFEREASPKEIAVELEQPVNNVTHHINVLVKLGCIELVNVRPAHGGRVAKHFYRTIRRAYFDAEMWEQLNENEKLDVMSTLVSLISQDVNEAMATGTFYDPDDNHISRTPIVVDLMGWKEITAILDRASEEVLGVEEAVAERAAAGETETMHVKVEIIQFRSPPPKKK